MRANVIRRGLIAVVIGTALVCGSRYFIQDDHRAALASSGKSDRGTADLSLMEIFKTRYDQVMRAVKEGKIPKNKGAEAERLWISLQKYVIDSNAKIETFKLDVRHSRGTRQEESVKNLIDTVARKERMLMDSLYRLEKQSGLTFGDIPLAIERADINSSVKGREVSSKKDKKKKFIEIESEPEDLIKDKQFLE